MTQSPSLPEGDIHRWTAKRKAAPVLDQVRAVQAGHFRDAEASAEHHQDEGLIPEAGARGIQEPEDLAGGEGGVAHAVKGWRMGLSLKSAESRQGVASLSVPSR